jgi:choline dehydrogenase-like flavoprotein
LAAGGKLLPATRVERLHLNGPRWTIQATHHAVGAVRVHAEKVFVCGGAVQTPALLRRSGFGQGIGNSLRLHPTIKVIARFPEQINFPGMGVPVHQVKEFAPRVSFGCSLSTPPYLAIGMLDHPAAGLKTRTEWPHLAAYYAMITGQGRGTVRIVPGFKDPLVRYQITEHDRRDLADGVNKLARILFESGAEKIYPAITNSVALSGLDDLSRLPDILPNGLGNLMTIHLFSSCPMGEDKAKCPVDSFGRVRGVKNLWVADASLLCSAPGVNPQGSIMAFAHRNVLHLLKQ